MSDAQSDSYLFVYGSLRNLPIIGQQHQLLYPAKHVGRATFHGKLFFLGHYPGAVLSKASDERITGEVYRLLEPSPTLERLDDYEGCGAADRTGSEFRREKVEVHLINGKTLTAWVYLYNRPTASLQQINSGDYLDFVNFRA